VLEPLDDGGEESGGGRAGKLDRYVSCILEVKSRKKEGGQPFVCASEGRGTEGGTIKGVAVLVCVESDRLAGVSINESEDVELAGVL